MWTMSKIDLSCLGLLPIPKEERTFIKHVFIEDVSRRIEDDSLRTVECWKEWLKEQDPGYVKFCGWDEVAD